MFIENFPLHIVCMTATCASFCISQLMFLREVFVWPFSRFDAKSIVNQQITNHGGKKTIKKGFTFALPPPPAPAHQKLNLFRGKSQSADKQRKEKYILENIGSPIRQRMVHPVPLSPTA